MVIEDLITAIYDQMERKVDPWSMPVGYMGRSFLPDPPQICGINDRYDLQFLWEIGFKIKNKKPISSKQGDLLIKILRKYVQVLCELGLDQSSTERLLDNPVYNVQPYQSHNIPREVRYLGNGVLLFRSMYNPKIVNEIKALKAKEEKKEYLSTHISFNGEYKLWLVEVSEQNFSRVMKLIKGFNFEFDDDVLQFFYICENSDKYCSSIVDEGGRLEITSFNDVVFSSWIEKMIDPSQRMEDD